MTLDAANADQADYWNGDAGRRWTAMQESQDKLFAPITAALFEAAAPQAGEAVIDVVSPAPLRVARSASTSPNRCSRGRGSERRRRVHRPASRSPTRLYTISPRRPPTS